MRNREKVKVVHANTRLLPNAKKETNDCRRALTEESSSLSPFFALERRRIERISTLRAALHPLKDGDTAEEPYSGARRLL